MVRINKFNEINEQVNQQDFQKYAARAEANVDVLTFLKEISDNVSEYKVWGILDMNTQVEFASNLLLDELLAIAEDAHDCHVIFRTLNYANDFNGEVLRS